MSGNNAKQIVATRVASTSGWLRWTTRTLQEIVQEMIKAIATFQPLANIRRQPCSGPDSLAATITETVHVTVVTASTTALKPDISLSLTARNSMIPTNRAIISRPQRTRDLLRAVSSITSFGQDPNIMKVNQVSSTYLDNYSRSTRSVRQSSPTCEERRQQHACPQNQWKSSKRRRGLQLCRVGIPELTRTGLWITARLVSGRRWFLPCPQERRPSPSLSLD